MTGFSVLWEGAMPIFHQEPNLSAAGKGEPKVFYIIICIKNQFFLNGVIILKSFLIKHKAQQTTRKNNYMILNEG